MIPRRPSLRAELVRLGVRYFIKRQGRPQTLEESRRGFRAMERLVPRPPRGTRTVRVDAGGVAADNVTTPAAQAGRHVLYLHGGGYRVGSPAIYRDLTWRIGNVARAQVLVIDYRLAPEHPFSAALDDAVAAYRWLLAGGDAREIVVMGESAGGGLTLALLLKLRDETAPLPVAGVAISPWTDLALTGASLAANAAADPMLDVGVLPGYVADYLAGADPRNPYASPLYGDPAGLPPVLLQVGSDEILLDDSTRMAEKLRAAGRPVELQVWPRMPHAWHMFAPILPEARAAIGGIGGFLQPLWRRTGH